MHLSETGVKMVTPTPDSHQAADADWTYANRVTGVPYVGQPTVDTHIMSILCSAMKFNVRRGIMLGSGHIFTAAKPGFWGKTALEPKTRRFGLGFVASL
jgi:hypothetical protein